jgi:hypothetical protein
MTISKPLLEKGLSILLPILAECVTAKTARSAIIRPIPRFVTVARLFEGLLRTKWPTFTIDVKAADGEWKVTASFSPPDEPTLAEVKELFGAPTDTASEVRVSGKGFPYQYEAEVDGVKYRAGTLNEKLVTFGMIVKGDAREERMLGPFKVLGHGPTDELQLLQSFVGNDKERDKAVKQANKAVAWTRSKFRSVTVCKVKLVSYPSNKPPKGYEPDDAPKPTASKPSKSSKPKPKSSVSKVKDYSISEARYSKNMMAVSCPSSDGYKTYAAQLAEKYSRGRYSHRENSYIMSKPASVKFEKEYTEWKAKMEKRSKS